MNLFSGWYKFLYVWPRTCHKLALLSSDRKKAKRYQVKRKEKWLKDSKFYHAKSNFAYRPYSWGYPLQGKRANLWRWFCLRDSPRGVTYIFILQIHVTRVVTFSAEELGSMSQNNLKGISLGEVWNAQSHVKVVCYNNEISVKTVSPRRRKCYGF